MVKREQLSNRAVTTLNGSVTDSATSITVTDGSIYPADGNFRVAINNEILLVTARATNVLTVERGVEGSGGSSHVDGSYVYAITTKANFDNLFDESIAPLSYPFRLLDDAGLDLDATDFTWVNQETSSVATETWGGLTMTAEGNTTAEWRVLTRTQPSTPYTLTAHVSSQPANFGSGEDAFGIGFRESVTGKLSTVQFLPNRNWDILQPSGFANGTPTAVTQIPHENGIETWLRVANDGTNLTYYVSTDSWNWMQLYTELLADHFTTAPDQTCWLLRAVSSLNTHEYHLNAWIEE